MTSPAFCICEIKGADQLRRNCEADQRLCFRYIDCTSPLLPNFVSSIISPSSVPVTVIRLLLRGEYHNLISWFV